MRRFYNVVLVAVALSTSAASLASAQVPAKAPTPASLLQKAQKALDAGQAKEALRQADAFVAKYPKRWDGFRLVARAAMLLDLPDRAEAAYRRALLLAPVAARPALETGLTEAATLRRALGYVARSQALKESGDEPGAARAQERAYQVLPSRVAFGLAAAELFEAAGEFDDVRRVLGDVRTRHPSITPETHPQIARLEAALKQEEERKAAEREAERQRLADEAARKARDAARARAEAERRAEEERQRAETIRLNREETDRLRRLLDEQKFAVADAETVVRLTEDRVSDAQRPIRGIESDLDEARDARSRAQREKEAWEDKVNNAKTDIERNVFRNELRTAEKAFESAREGVDRVNRRLDEAKSRISEAEREAGSARSRLDQARRNVSDTESAIARIASG